MATKIVVRHFHEGNDADRAVRGSSTYATVARVIDLETGEQLVADWAFCGKKDTPSRAQGRFIAIGRLQKQYPEHCANANFGVFESLRLK